MNLINRLSSKFQSLTKFFDPKASECSHAKFFSAYSSLVSTYISLTRTIKSSIIPIIKNRWLELSYSSHLNIHILNISKKMAWSGSCLELWATNQMQSCNQKENMIFMHIEHGWKKHANSTCSKQCLLTLTSSLVYLYELYGLCVSSWILNGRISWSYSCEVAMSSFRMCVWAVRCEIWVKYDVAAKSCNNAAALFICSRRAVTIIFFLNNLNHIARIFRQPKLVGGISINSKPNR